MDKKMKRQTESEEAYRKSSGDRSGHGRDLIPRNRMTAISHSARSKALAQLPWRQWVEPWYFIYALQGVVIGGIAPMLLPLAVVRAGSPLYVGLVMAAFSLGGLTAPLWGRLAEYLRWPRWLLIGGFLLTAFGLVAFAFTTAPIVWVALALLQGSGAARATTMANSFIVEARPQEQWEQRMGWLQTFYGGGQVAGLLLTGLLVQADVRTGLLVAAGLSATAAFLVIVVTQPSFPSPTSGPTPISLPPHSEWTHGFTEFLAHGPLRQALRPVWPAVASPFGLFLASWLISFIGTAAFFSLYPVLMQQVFAATPRVSCTIYAMAAGLALILYPWAGQSCERYSATKVLTIGMSVRLAAFLGLLCLGLTQPTARSGLALFIFTFVVLAWSLLTVSGTALTARLSASSKTTKGEAMGLFTAASGVAGVIGAALGGWVAGHWGYAAVLALSVCSLCIGLLLIPSISFSKHSTGGSEDGPASRRYSSTLV
jgi:DHA1 family tetracycline resistance protein-like MFS transporter